MKNIIKTKWDEILKYLITEYSITDVSYNTWLKPLKVYDVKDNVITILINDERIGPPSLNVIRNKYELLLKVSIEEIMNVPYEINFVLASQIDSLDNNKKTTTWTKPNIPSFLNSRYTFDTFVVGGNNEFARAAALAVAENPGEIYNPLFIYGGVGLGKTHLMHSIAHFVLNQNPETKVLYVTSEKFTNELIESIQKKTTMQFREKYRSIDILLIDDIQFIIGKESTQEEFFHTFNTLYEANKQIVVSSDRPPKDIPTLEERLRSRFEWGLIADIQAPDLETRVAILRKKAILDNLDIDDEVLTYIATHIDTNIRELEGALIRVMAYSTITSKSDITVDLASEALNEILPDSKPKIITIKDIIKVVAEYFHLQVQDLVGKKRTRTIAHPRQIAMYLCREFTDASFPKIGEEFGGRDHTTIMHANDKISRELNKDPELEQNIAEIKRRLQ